ncbi:MAG TPA: gas vesicle protein K [Longimicrobiales bacterium]|nr:gas vesicle protein K [Longimicrobiales bacterium]
MTAPLPASDEGSGLEARAETDAPELFAAELRDIAAALPQRLEAEPEDIDAGLARLVLTLIEFIRRILEHQAVRRMEGGGLSDEEVERLGLALLRLEEKLEDIKEVFGLEGEDLNIDLGPLGRLL